MARFQTISAANTTASLTTAEAKTHLRIDFSNDDTYIDNLVRVAEATCEKYTNRYFLDTTVIQHCDTWEETKILYSSPVSAVSSIKYYDNDGVLTTWTTDDYDVSLVDPCRIALADTKAYPSVQDRIAAIQVEYVVGYGSAASSVPLQIKQAMLVMVAQMYENRQSVIVGRTAAKIPMTAEYLLDQYKIQLL